MATKGRRRISEEPLDGYNVRLTPGQARKARRIGAGNMAEGVRKALDDAPWPSACELLLPGGKKREK